MVTTVEKCCFGAVIWSEHLVSTCPIRSLDERFAAEGCEKEEEAGDEVGGGDDVKYKML